MPWLQEGEPDWCDVEREIAVRNSNHGSTEENENTEPKQSVYDDAFNVESGRVEVQQEPKVQVGRSEVGLELGEVEIMESVDCF